MEKDLNAMRNAIPIKQNVNFVIFCIFNFFLIYINGYIEAKVL